MGHSFHRNGSNADGTPWTPDDDVLHSLTGGYVVVRTIEADPDNDWDAAVVVCASLDSRAYASPEVARALAADLLAAADAVEAAASGSSVHPTKAGDPS